MTFGKFLKFPKRILLCEVSDIFKISDTSLGLPYENVLLN